MKEFDVIIIGGGLVGSACALGLKNAGLNVALVERHPPQIVYTGTQFDSRIYAISPSSEALLTQIGAWDKLPESRLTPVYDMRIFGDDNQARLTLSAYQQAVSHLATILESTTLQQGLWHALNESTHVDIFAPVACQDLHFTSTHATLTLTNGDQLQAALIIAADGSESWTRQQAGIQASVSWYHQKGVVANFRTQKAHHSMARQWFYPESILAYLPLPNRYLSIVWSCFDTEAERIKNLNPQDFCQKVAEAGHFSLGDLELVTPPQAFPLRLMNVEKLVSSRLVLIGDAAHLAHPLAGQGVNLGFEDVIDLIDVLTNRGGYQDVGQIGLLEQYARRRYESIRSLQLVTDGLQKLFNQDLNLPKTFHPLIKTLRNRGLTLTEKLPFLKYFLISQAL